jgi:hypothetical protein
MPAESKVQGRAAGMALAAKRGEIRVSQLKGAAREMFNTMSTQQLRDFATTKGKRLPERKKKST